MQELSQSTPKHKLTRCGKEYPNPLLLKDKMQHLFIIWSLKSQLFISFSKDSRHLFTLSEWPTLAHSSSLKDLSSFMPPYVHCSASTHSQLEIEVSLQKSIPQRCIAWLLSKHRSRYPHLHFSSCLTIWIFFFLTGLLFISLHSPNFSSVFEISQKKNLICLSYYPSSPVPRVHTTL